MPRTTSRSSGPVNQDPNIPIRSPSGVTVSTQLVRTGADVEEPTLELLTLLTTQLKSAITSRIRRYYPYRDYTNDQLDQIHGN